MWTLAELRIAWISEAPSGSDRVRLLLVVGARPNFVKAEPLLRAFDASDRVDALLIHTGQHYDPSLSSELFADLGLRAPDRHLGIGSGSRAQQVANIAIAFEPVCLETKPDQIVVVGDVNSTLAAALVAQGLGVPLAHVEAGLRSRDRTMPEEINRLLTDILCDTLFTSTVEAGENLIREGVDEARIHFVGNVMIDTLLRLMPKARERAIFNRWGLGIQSYALATVHRPGNVDEPGALNRLAQILMDTARQIPTVFSIHPRTMLRLRESGLTAELESAAGFFSIYPPLSYIDFLNLMMNARVVLTDSGGIQEETTVLGIPCLTLRPNTERPITLSLGTNRLVGTDPPSVRAALKVTLDSPMPDPVQLPMWDGQAADRIAKILIRNHDLMADSGPLPADQAEGT